MRKTFASIFTGGGLADIGAEMAGLQPIFGVEIDPDIAAVAEMNTPSKVIVSRAQDVDYSQLESPYWLHVSTECKRASIASGNKESEEDLTQAHSVERALFALLPEKFSLENVWNYRSFQSFLNICNALCVLGYRYEFWHLNSANYGVPQTRRRLILVASRSNFPRWPHPTHARNPKPSLFESLPRWRGWYQAIEDIVDDLPESSFAEWQHNRIPECLKGSFLVGVQGENGDLYRWSDSPAPTIAASHGANKYRAFIVEATAAGEGNKFSLPIRLEAEPIFTVRAGSNYPRAFIVDCQKAGTPDALGERGLTIRGDNEPCFTISNGSKRPARAWLSCGRTVRMTVRANARFQSIPDSYKFTGNNKLDSKIVGNAVPPLLMQRIVEANYSD